MRPTNFPNQIQALPVELSPLFQVPHWVGWRLVERRGKVTKPPISLRTGRITDIRNSEAWVSYRRALRLLDDVEVDGLGFVLLNSKIAALDIDNGVHNGEIVPWAAALLDRTHSYVERTPSGHGLRILGFGTGRPVHTKWKIGSGSLEVYRRATRFITVTGALFDHADLEPIDNLIDELVEEHGSAAPKTGGVKKTPPVSVPKTGRVKKTPPVSDVPSPDIDTDDWVEIVDGLKCAGPCTRSPTNGRNRGCHDLRRLVQSTIRNGDRSDVCFKLVKILIEHDASREQAATVLRESAAFSSKWNTETALWAEINRIFGK